MLSRTSASHAYYRGLKKEPFSFLSSADLSSSRPLSNRSIWRESNRQAHRSLKPASTLASSTAVNATKEIPARAQELYDKLTAVKDSAASYVSLSRLQLALRGLETENPVIRVALLGVEDRTTAARQFAKVLLVDPLSTELPWESDLETIEDDGRSILLRYGDVAGIAMENPLLRTLLIPSPVLKAYNLEILIANLTPQSAVPIDGTSTVNPAHLMLVPRLELQASTGNQFTAVHYPAHKSILYGEGVCNCLELGRLTVGWPDSQISRRMMKVVFGLRASLDERVESVEDQVAAVDVELASSAIKSFRESIQNATKFEHEWFRSGMPAVADWLAQDLNRANRPIKPAIRHLTRSLLDDAEEAIMGDEMHHLRTTAASAVPEDKRRSIRDSLDVWAERAHTELRDQMDIAFNGRGWRRLKWWKLFWRVDDIEMIATDVLQRRWLVQAEKDIIWLTGRIEGAGFFRNSTDMTRMLDTNPVVGNGQSKNEENPDSASTPPSPMSSTDLPFQVDPHQSPPSFGPWPRNISLARTRMSMEAVPFLQLSGQVLVWKTVNLSLFSTVFSGMLYFFVEGTSIYGVGAVAALGIAWSMRSLQRQWETERQGWESEVRESGRKVLKDTQDTVAAIIDKEGRAEEHAEDVKERRVAKASINMARQALSKLE
ncbi:MAG: hypothetical protein M1816_003458 [Peltula sp. TS41687]|nr:MAG: hypothetical protein M1816_003458 [Peltula sp. TS41687]